VSLDPRAELDTLYWVPAFGTGMVRIYNGDRFHLEGVNVGPEPERFRGAVFLRVILTADVQALRKRGRT
jgi:hypothetical protein